MRPNDEKLFINLKYARKLFNTNTSMRIARRVKGSAKLVQALIGCFLEGLTRVRHYIYKWLDYVQPLVHVKLYTSLF